VASLPSIATLNIVNRFDRKKRSACGQVPL
jgi:hypothetical protein